MLDRIFNKTTREERFWQWFERNSDRYLLLDEVNRVNLFIELSDELHKVDSNLTFEFSSLLENGHRQFVISADGIRTSFPSVTKLVQLAPNIRKWDIIAFRQPKTGYSQIEYNGVTVDFNDVYFRYSKENGKLGLELNIKNYHDSREWIVTTFLMLDVVIGEFDTEMSLGCIERKKLLENEIGSLNKLEELPMILEGYKKEYNN